MGESFDLVLQYPSDRPTEPGYYLVWPHLSDRPPVAWWSATSSCWRNGLTEIRADAWAGPLPTRGRS